MLSPYKPVELKKVPCAFKLPQWLLDWLRDQPQSQAVLIENALCKTYKLKPPTELTEVKKPKK